MRKLVLLRGLPGCGKSTWVKEMNLEPWTLSSDTMRLLFRSPELTTEGRLSVSQKASSKAWPLLMTVLEARMQNGEFTIVDATNIKEKDINSYRELCEKYRYEALIVDFTDISKEAVLARNEKRKPHFSYVPEKVIDDMALSLSTQRQVSWAKYIRPEEFLSAIQEPVIDLSRWKKVHHIGDIQSCYTPLQKFFEDGLKSDEFYIFVGDFLDRGLEHAEVLSFILDLSENENVLFVEGNHEIHLWNWASGLPQNSSEFSEKTRPALEAQNYDLKKVKKLCRKFKEMFVYSYFDKTVMVTHGGLPHVPSVAEMPFIAASTYIKGTGLHSDDIDEAFNTSSRLKLGEYQIHGHRNNQGNPIKNIRSWNLEGKVEFGGYLRIVTLDKVGFTGTEILNQIEPQEKDVVASTGLVEMLRGCRLIKERDNGFGISSFNFNREAFYDGVWNTQTVKARGLFVHTESNEIVARSYDKFFNLGELSLTTFDSLRHNLKFPVNVYVKENGFLGIVGYDRRRDELLISSKASSANEFAMWFKEILSETVDMTELKKIASTGVSLVFEVIDPVNDPHIIGYDMRKVVLLDVIKNEIEFDKYSDSETRTVAAGLGCEVKRAHRVLENWLEFQVWHQEVSVPGYKLGGSEDVEGFVIEDSRKFMTKIKLEYYSFWKFMRSVKDRHFAGKPALEKVLANPKSKEFVDWLIANDHPEEARGIIKLRERYLLSRAVAT
jgi:predicted kinase